MVIFNSYVKLPEGIFNTMALLKKFYLIDFNSTAYFVSYYF